MRFVQKAFARILRYVPDGIVHALLVPLPATLRGRLRHRFARLRFYQFMKKRLGKFIVEIESGTVGDVNLIMRTAVLKEEDAPKKLDPDHYFESGYIQMQAWMQTLERCGLNLRTLGAIMEVGCGSARLIRHLRCMEGVRLVGADVKPEMIEWCSKNVPGIEFYSNGLEPPLPFANDATFDLIFMSSVFTHIPKETQLLWIKEMYRVLRPGGYLLCDVLGRYHQDLMLDAEDRARLKKDGELTLTAADAKASLSTKLIGSWDYFQTRAEVVRVFGSVFTLVDYIPSYLDLLVLKKPRSAS